MVYYKIAGIPYSPELYHHGIKGQKWGIRRYQNSDGTLTAAGKERYDRNLQKMARKDAQRQSDANAAYGTGAGTRRKLLDKELKEKMKNPDYKKHFDKEAKNVDVAKSLKRAESLHRHSGDFERGQRLADSGRNVKNITLKSIGRLGATALATGVGYSIFGKGNKLATACIIASGSINAASIIGRGARDAYQVNYYERNKKF